MNGTLSFLGLMMRAGRLLVGEDTCKSAAREGEAKVILLAKNAGENTAKKAGKAAKEGMIPCVELPFGKEEIAAAVGKGISAILAINDIEMASGLLEKLTVRYPEGDYSEVAADLKDKAEKKRQRAKEKKAHERNLRFGKKSGR